MPDPTPPDDPNAPSAEGRPPSADDAPDPGSTRHRTGEAKAQRNQERDPPA